jgi:hypothetical protein
LGSRLRRFNVSDPDIAGERCDLLVLGEVTPRTERISGSLLTIEYHEFEELSDSTQPKPIQ